MVFWSCLSIKSITKYVLNWQRILKANEVVTPMYKGLSETRLGVSCKQHKTYFLSLKTENQFLLSFHIFERGFIQKCKKEWKINYFHQDKISIVEFKKNFMNKNMVALRRNHEKNMVININLRE